MWALAILTVLTLASMVLAERMARSRHRSTKAWLWISAIVGPLGPVALYLMGEKKEMPR